MAYPQTYIPHTDLDPAQPPYSFTPSYPAANFSQPRHPLQGQAQHFHHAPNQQYGLPNQAHGHGPPSSMPPPSFYRQNYPYGSEPRAPDRWPLGITDDQRQQCKHLASVRSQKDLYPYKHPAHSLIAQAPHAFPTYHQHSPISSAPLAGPVSSFPTPPQNRSPSQNQPPHTPQNFRSPPAVAQKSQPPMTAAAVKAVPPSNPTPSTLPADASKSGTSSRVSPTLEAHRVSTLLELNRVLLQEVVKDQAVQNAQKAASNPSQPQSNPLQTNPSSTADASKAADTHTQPDTTGASSATEKYTDATAEDSKVAPSSTNRATPQQQQPPNKVPHTKEYVEYMRRLQANLAYLASVADRNHKPGNAVPLFPAIMEAPVLPPPAATQVKQQQQQQQQQKDNAEQEGAGDAKETIKQLYGKIKDLWPEYKGPGTAAASGGAPPTQARQVATSAA
ncbi:MAG: hypothetical protein LQ341_003632 [Variospora aurantia]|nr:MAG: hypothetical protein LQ341_003632 [Variospora aurantia]